MTATPGTPPEGQTLADLTTTGVGGAPSRIVAPETRDGLIAAARTVFAEETDEAPVLIVGGGSNLVIANVPYAGTVLHVVTRGIEMTDADDAGRVRVLVEAGHPWVELVNATVDAGLSGIEALAGIPGSSGAAPVQNIGAYGQEVGERLTRIEFLDAETGEVEWLAASDLDLGYRASVLKRRERIGVVTRIELELERRADGMSGPVAYSQLANRLGVELGERAPLTEVRDAVVALRASKGMVIDENDPDSRSSGSFFTNPIVLSGHAKELPENAPKFPAGTADDGRALTKLSAAWLIEHAGIHRGFALPGSGAAVSSKHTLAIVNRDGATGEEVAELARFIQARVASEFGVELRPEPILVGLEV